MTDDTVYLAIDSNGVVIEAVVGNPGDSRYTYIAAADCDGAWIGWTRNPDGTWSPPTS